MADEKTEEVKLKRDVRFAWKERRKETRDTVFAWLFMLALMWVIGAGIGWAADSHGDRAPFMAYLLPGSEWAYERAYGMGASSVQVHIDPEPSDCDFLRAPLGSKGCHFERKISLLRYAQNAATGEIRSLISHDAGKSWESGDPVPVAGTWRIDVTWRRVQD